MSDELQEAGNLPLNPLENPIEKLSVGRKTKAALEAMAVEAISAGSAAKRFNIRQNNLTRYFNRPDVMKAFNQRRKQVRDNAAQNAYMRINHMGEHAQSDRLKFDANRWIAGVDGLAPVQKVEGRHLHQVQFGGFEFNDPKDVTPDSPSSDE